MTRIDTDERDIFVRQELAVAEERGRQRGLWEANKAVATCCVDDCETVCSTDDAGGCVHEGRDMAADAIRALIEQSP